MLARTLDLAKELIAQVSISPEDADCQKILINRLEAMGFQVESLPFGKVKNFYARKGRADPILLFAGHTDVVPPGPLEKWSSPPFQPTIRNDCLYGRGAADMKSSLAAMICACEIFLQRYPDHKGSIGFLVTSDEEGLAVDGTQQVVRLLQQRHEKITWCIVGEASSEDQFGDMIKIGRRGSLHGVLTICGQQGHIAYPQKAENPIHKSLQALDELTKTIWDQGNEYFPPTSLQISNIHAGTGAENVIPGSLEVIFNFRFSTQVTVQGLQEQVHAILDKHRLEYHLAWRISGEPFLSQPGKLHDAAFQVLQTVANIQTQPSTTGGTSDGRFIIDICPEILEIGPINKSIHKVDEHITLKELELLTQVYNKMMIRLLVDE